MASIPVDATRQVMIYTGVSDLVREWDEKDDGTRRPSDRQARDEATGFPLWGVEVLYQHVSWGRVSSVTAKVTVPAMAAPDLVPLTPVTFTGLVVDIRVNKAGALVESWRAEGIAPAGAAANDRKAAA